MDEHLLEPLGKVRRRTPNTQGAEHLFEGPDRLLTPTEVATRLGLGRTKTYDLLARRVLPTVRLGPRTTRVPERALQKWIAERTLTGEDP